MAVGHLLGNTGIFGSVEPHQTKSRSKMNSELVEKLIISTYLDPWLLWFTIVWLATACVANITYLATNLAKRAIAPR